MEQFLKQLFNPGGLLSQTFPHYEERIGQIEMAKTIGEAYLKDRIAIVEAGTGIGKSLAYLAPAVFWAIRHGERTVISTHTIALQEQLTQKDIPFLLDLLGADLKAVLVKGMGNYACLKKFYEWDAKDPDLMRWIESTDEGSRSDIEFALPHALWDKVSAEPSRCTGAKCPFYKPCFFFKARKKLEEAKLLVVNHHLLMADLKAGEEAEILPRFDRLIIDEAHNFEDVALDSLSKRVDRLSLISTLGAKFEEFGSEIPAMMRSISVVVEEAFRRIDALLPTGASMLRIQKPFPTEILEVFALLQDDLTRLAAVMRLAAKKAIEAVSTELRVVGEELEKRVETLETFFAVSEKKSCIRWIERSANNLSLCESDLDIAVQLRDMIFSRFSTTTLCSATLAAGREFSFVKSRLGIEGSNRHVVEAIYDSPFNYEKQVFFGIPSDICLPQEPQFIQEAAKLIRDCLYASAGGAFVLFTSYDMLNQCYGILKDKFSILRQGDAARSVLLERFKELQDGVLFGTDSFWEGVDVPGDALRCVIITKLPFKVPDDPIVEGRSEMLKESGKNPFMDYLVPEAALKFKQGFGRLMRRRTDRGCIICLDKRIKTKPYGQVFLKSLPSCSVHFEPSKKIVERIEMMDTLPPTCV